MAMNMAMIVAMPATATVSAAATIATMATATNTTMTTTTFSCDDGDSLYIWCMQVFLAGRSSAQTGGHDHHPRTSNC